VTSNFSTYELKIDVLEIFMGAFEKVKFLGWTLLYICIVVFIHVGIYSCTIPGMLDLSLNLFIYALLSYCVNKAIKSIVNKLVDSMGEHQCDNIFVNF
jgi:hypothetical protein